MSHDTAEPRTKLRWLVVVGLEHAREGLEFVELRVGVGGRATRGLIHVDRKVLIDIVVEVGWLHVGVGTTKQAGGVIHVGSCCSPALLWILVIVVGFAT